MASDTATRDSRLRVSGVRSLDHIQASVRSEPKRNPGRHRIRMHVPSSKIGRAYHLGLAWGIILFVSGVAGAFLAFYFSKGR